MLYPSVTGKAKEIKQWLDCVASNRAETHGMLSHIHSYLLQYSVKWERVVYDARMEIMYLQLSCKSPKTLLPFLRNYNPLTYQSQGLSLRIPWQHLALCSARLHKPSRREHTARGNAWAFLYFNYGEESKVFWDDDGRLHWWFLWWKPVWVNGVSFSTVEIMSSLV